MWEWCQDWFNAKEEGRVLRWDSWNYDDPGALLSSARSSGRREARVTLSGFGVC